MPNPICALEFADGGDGIAAGKGMNKTRTAAMKRSAMAPTTLRMRVFCREMIKHCLLTIKPSIFFSVVQTRLYVLAEDLGKILPLSLDVW